MYKTYIRTDHCVIYVDNDIFIIGGLSQVDGFFLKSVSRLDLKKRDCFEEPPMNNCRSRFSSCVLNGYIYAIGGMGKKTQWAEHPLEGGREVQYKGSTMGSHCRHE